MKITEIEWIDDKKYIFDNERCFIVKYLDLYETNADLVIYTEQIQDIYSMQRIAQGIFTEVI